MRRVADALQQALVDQGASWFVGFPGESTLSWYAAARSAGREHVCARCERCAGYMADAYARVSGSVPVVDAPGGVGSPYLVPALHEARNSSVPLVAVVTDAGADATSAWRTATCDNAAMLGAVSKAVVRLNTPQEVPTSAAECLLLARTGRPGPVTLLVRDGLLEKPAQAPPAGERGRRQDVSTPAGEDAAIEDDLRVVLERLRSAKQPLLICGGGVHAACAHRRVAQLAQRLGVPVATTFNGIGAVPASDPRYIGTVGAKGRPESNAYAAEADVVVWLGSKRGDKTTQYGCLPAAGAWSAVVDIDPGVRVRPPHADLYVIEDLDAALSRLLVLAEGVGPRRAPATAVDAGQAATPDSTGWLLQQAVALLPSDTVVVADASKASSWVGAFVAPRRAGRFVIAPRGSGAIGWGLPAALGAAVARPDHHVLAVVGDGGFLMAAHELDVAARLGLRVTVLILNNHRLELLDQVGRDRYGPDFALPETAADLSALARALGVAACDARDPKEALRLVVEAPAARKPLVVNYAIPAYSESPDLVMHRARTKSVPW